jgi:23S rRNA pseudouridine1911/1915/1917 synthase
MKMKVKEASVLEETVLRMLDSSTKSKVRKLIRNHRVTVDGEAVNRPAHKVSRGQTVEIVKAGRERPVKTVRPSGGKRLPFPVLFEDEFLIIVDKPSGMLSIATERERSRTLYRMVSDYVKASTEGEKRIFIVHRLDRDVSGVMVLAKDEKTKRRLQGEWSSAEKIYSAVLDGHPPQKEGTVEGWLCENRAHRVYACDKTKPGAEKALTHYRVVNTSGSRSVVEVRLGTGRKHQIRVHMASLGCPISGDRLYGTHVRGMSGIGLHALSLSFDHPHTRRRITTKSPLPRRLKDLLRAPR